MSQSESHNASRKGGAAVKVAIGIVVVVVGLSTLNVAPNVLPGLEFNVGKIITSLGLLIVLMPVIESFFIQPLATAINERNSELEKTFGEAEGLREEMSTMKAEYEKRLAATEADARAKIEAQIKQAQTLKLTLMAEASSKADTLLEQAREEIESEKQRLLGDLRSHVVDLSLLAAGRVVGENMNDARNRKLVQEFVHDLEAVK